MIWFKERCRVQRSFFAPMVSLGIEYDEVMGMLVVILVFLLGLGLWLLGAWLQLPMFGADTTLLCCARGDGEAMERQVRAYHWLLKNGMAEGTVLIVDCGLTARGLTAAQLLGNRWEWVRNCPLQALGDYLELAEDKV